MWIIIRNNNIIFIIYLVVIYVILCKDFLITLNLKTQAYTNWIWLSGRYRSNKKLTDLVYPKTNNK